MKSLSWEKILNEISELDLLITGRHHAICACLITCTPFIPIPSNSHKIEGLIASTNTKIPIVRNIKELDHLIEKVIDGSLEKEFEKAFMWIRKFNIEDAMPILNE